MVTNLFLIGYFLTQRMYCSHSSARQVEPLQVPQVRFQVPQRPGAVGTHQGEAREPRGGGRAGRAREDQRGEQGQQEAVDGATAQRAQFQTKARSASLHLQEIGKRRKGAQDRSRGDGGSGRGRPGLANGRVRSDARPARRRRREKSAAAVHVQEVWERSAEGKAAS